jgi:endonuclease-3 related protein
MKQHPFKLYTILYNAFGPQHWWPMDHSHHRQNNTDPRFEVMIGAILTQNTAWTNVEKAIEQLKDHDLVSIPALKNADADLVKTCIRSSGYFNQKAKRLQLFASHIQEKYDGDLDRFFSKSTKDIRQELLSLHGIGPETADSMLLYAGDKPIFVVDAYTKRLCNRLPLPVDADSYDDTQHYFEEKLQTQYVDNELVQVYNEFHALIVNLGKYYCKPKPVCANCPLLYLCVFGQERKKRIKESQKPFDA